MRSSSSCVELHGSWYTFWITWQHIRQVSTWMITFVSTLFDCRFPSIKNHCKDRTDKFFVSTSSSSKRHFMQFRVRHGTCFIFLRGHFFFRRWFLSRSGKELSRPWEWHPSMSPLNESDFADCHIGALSTRSYLRFLLQKLHCGPAYSSRHVREQRREDPPHPRKHPLPDPSLEDLRREPTTDSDQSDLGQSDLDGIRLRSVRLWPLCGMCCGAVMLWCCYVVVLLLCECVCECVYDCVSVSVCVCESVSVWVCECECVSLWNEGSQWRNL